MARLTAALIVRDEEALLPACLASLEGVADEIVVLDTGSRDRSAELARAAGARVHHHTWQDDFAAARNAALEAAAGDWILYIDADERVVGGRPATLAAQLRDPRNIGLTVLFSPAADYTPYLEHRLFRRHDEIRFTGSIHETHLPSLEALAKRRGLRIAHSELQLRHVGYDGEMERKHRRNLPLLEARLDEDPEHVYSWWHLGHTLLGLGHQAEAIAAWRRGLQASRDGGKQDGAAAMPYLALLQHEQPLEESLLEEALARFPDLPQLRWLRARMRIDQGSPELAVHDLIALSAVDPSRPVAADIAVNSELFEVLAPRSLAHIYLRLNRYGEAAVLFRRLERTPRVDEAERQELGVKARFAELRATDGKSVSNRLSED
ncbi:MAG: glycosyltransferase [Holophagales bacterium]|nr:glycosyltransferase [Holophagales bacterium]